MEKKNYCAMELPSKIRRAVKPKKPWNCRPEVLLCPHTPEPMHCTTPRSILGGAWWNTTRQKAYRSTNYHCVACGVSKHQTARGQLEGHEMYDVDYERGWWTYVETVPLCSYCHNYIHLGRLAALLERRKITQARYIAILQHGDDVLYRASLRKPVAYDGPMAEWAAWRLIIDGKLYPPRFPTVENWLKEFGND